MKSALVKKLTTCETQLQKIKTRPVFRQPYDKLNQYRLKLDNDVKHLFRNNEMLMKDKKSQFALLAGKLDALSPLKIFERGYSVVRNPEGRIINSLEQVKVGDLLEVSLKGGKANCKVISTNGNMVKEGLMNE
jgi:exodeoxyribonuclease VII large subunit